MMKKLLFFITVGLLMAVQSGAEVTTIKHCEKTALDKYMPLQLAEEEIDVREAKALEAARALWPQLDVKGELTHGASIVELGTPGFREGSYGVQLTQTLFSGGKLWATFREAAINRKIAEEKYRKAGFDMKHQLKEAYWNLVRVKENYKQYEKAISKSENYLKMAKQLFKDGAIKKRTLLATETHRNSVMYQKQGSMAEIEKYKWNLAAASGLDEPADWILENEIPVEKTDVQLKDCIEKAVKHNPEYLIQQLSLKAAKYEKQVHYSQDWPKIELNGFYGRSGGAYNSEDLELNEDYNISIKLTQNIAWNSLALSGFDQKTSPKLGQSSRTESRSGTATLGILNGYKSAAEKKEASWQFNQANYNKQKAMQTLMVEVREAYFNVKKGQAQVENARLEVELAKSELAIQTIHLRDEKASVSDVAEASSKLTNSMASYNEAKVFYLLALSALDKAVGIEGYSTNNQKEVAKK